MAQIFVSPQKQPPSLNNKLWRGHRFITFGARNSYPQDCRRVLEASPTGSACRGRFADFLEGDGFENEAFMQARINFHGQRVWQLLNQVCIDYATHNYFAIHVNYNLALEPVSYTRINPEFVRLGLPDSYGFSSLVALSQDWLSDNMAKIEQARIDHVNIFNPEPEVVARQIEAAGGIHKYKGQVYVYWGNDQQYPLAPHHSVLKAMRTEAGIIEHKLSQVNNGFTANHVFVFPEPFESKTEQNEVKAELQGMIGPTGDRVGIVAGVGESGFRVEALQQTAQDHQFEATDEGNRNRIIRAYQQPSILHNEFRKGALGGTTEIENAFILYNETTRKSRNIIGRCFSELFEAFGQDLNPGGNYDIIPLKFEGNENRNSDSIEGGFHDS